MKQKTLINLFISLLLCIGLLPLNVFAASSIPTGIWTDHTANSFVSGSGTTTSCSYNAKKNTNLTAIGLTSSTGTNDITAQNNILYTICTSYYNHHDLLKTDGKPVTSTNDGFETYWKCKKCDSYFSDEKGINKITSPIIIKAVKDPKTIDISTLKVTLSKTNYTYNGKKNSLLSLLKITKHTQTSKIKKKKKTKKKYYVRIRSYKTTKINGKSYNAYSPWSKAKKSIVKK